MASVMLMQLRTILEFDEFTLVCFFVVIHVSYFLKRNVAKMNEMIN